MVEVMGARALKLHKAWLFHCEPFLQRWMQSCYEARLELKRQGRTIGAKMLKLVMNSIYGKLVQNMENYGNTSVYTDVKSFKRAQEQATASNWEIQVEEMEEGGCFLGIVHRIRAKPQLQRSPVQVGWRVLELSRLMMLRNHYEGIKRIFPSARLLFTDTDSAMYQIFGDQDPVKLLAAANERGDMPCWIALTPTGASSAP